MQEINRAALIKRASELLSDGTADRVLGWKAGEFDYDVTPAVFHSVEELEKDFVWGDFCGANFSKYLIKETQKGDGKVLIFVKPCDTYSFNQLLTEHRFDREKVCPLKINLGKAYDAMPGFTKSDEFKPEYNPVNLKQESGIDLFENRLNDFLQENGDRIRREHCIGLVGKQTQ